MKHVAPFPQAGMPGKSLAPKRKVREAMQGDRRLQSSRREFFSFFFTEIVLYIRHPAATRGAFRDRHERGRRDAVDASVRETSALDADDEAVWSRSPDAGIKSPGLTKSCAATVAREPGAPRRSRYKS